MYLYIKRECVKLTMYFLYTYHAVSGVLRVRF